MRFSWFWPLIILLSGVATELVTLLLPGQAVTMLITMWFLFVCPGMAFLRFFRLGTLIVEITIAVALSLSIDAIVTGIFLYAHAWNPSFTLLSLVILSALGAIGQLVFMRESTTQAVQNNLNIVGEGKVEEVATIAVPATHIAALTRNEDKRTVKAASVAAQARIEEASTSMLPSVPQTPRQIEEISTNMLPSVPQTPKQVEEVPTTRRRADELPTSMLPVAHSDRRNVVENMPTSMLPSVPETPRLNEDLPTSTFPAPSTDELAQKGQKSAGKEGTRNADVREQERKSSSHYSRKKKRLTSLRKSLSSSDAGEADKPIEDRSTIISMREH